MNKELIEKLKKDSQMICGYTDGGYTPLYALDSEKFAELIVKECIWRLECAKQGDSFTGETYNNEVNDVLASQIDNLKEHFGIE